MVDFKNVSKHFMAVGGFKTAKGSLYFCDAENNVMYAFNDRESKVKQYTMGNGGTSWNKTMTFEEFQQRCPMEKVSK